MSCQPGKSRIPKNSKMSSTHTKCPPAIHSRNYMTCCKLEFLLSISVGNFLRECRPFGIYFIG
jgi:hypothetical protein